MQLQGETKMNFGTLGGKICPSRLALQPDRVPCFELGSVSGSAVDLTIRELAETIAEVVGFEGEFVQDTSKPDGTMRKIMDVSKLCQLGWSLKSDLPTGVALAYQDYQNRNIQ